MRSSIALAAMAAACGSVNSSPDAPPPSIDAPAGPPDAPMIDAEPVRCFALHFDGTTQRVRVPHAPSLAGGGPMTVEAWIRPNAGVVNPPGYPNLIGKRNSSSIYPTWGFGLSDVLHVYSVEDSTWAYGTGEVSLNAWTHVAVVFDGAQVRMYRGGALDFTVPATAQGPTNTEDVFIGTLPTNAQNYRGDVAGVRVSTVARYTAEFQPTTTWAPDGATVLLLRMDEGAGIAVADTSPSNNTGEVIGATWIAECP
jgi:hypothetical protein